MCRLFGMTAGRERVNATFWLLDADDSMSRQSRQNPDGTGLGTFDTSGRPMVEKQPVAAFDDAQFALEARERESSTFIAHVRYATGTPKTPENTHPFEIDGRIFAHNGVVGDLETLERELGPDLSLVRGDTDSERVFALVTREIRSGQEVGDALARAVRWLADNVPVFAINVVLTTASDLWAVRYPETHELWILERGPLGAPVQHRSSQGTQINSDELGQTPCVVVASERLDDDPGWRLLAPGTLVHVGDDLRVDEQIIVATPPRRRLQP